MLRPIRISWIIQRGYHVEPIFTFKEVRQENRIVAVTEVRFTHIFYIR